MNRQAAIGYLVGVVGIVFGIVMMVQKGRVEDDLAQARADRAQAAAAADPWASGGGGDATGGPAIARGLGGRIDGVDAPKLPDTKKESRLERRARRTDEIAAMLGRLDGETEEEYRARLLPLLEAALSRPRENVAQLRKEIEEKAGVTDEQRQKLDATFDEVYDELLTYTNAAIQDGQLTPYERNVAGMLEYAGGLGAILGGAEQRIGGILSPEQQQTIYGSGFEWAEYLGVTAPWERLTPPPPPGGGS